MKGPCWPVARGAFPALAGTAIPWRQQAAFGWFGVCGIGSLYYLMYTIDRGLPENVALELLHVTLIVVTLSILVHGISVRMRPRPTTPA